eukprot:TRINITY_DN3855_c1_g1_i2.p1 TRINITY_DN3855_c1_g1~~TRINITY_DN3855_c1_g1_i2.p1  ORF type:complete len:207 (-),score=72.88 TRINITY_DN3855_c1_g1_i2:124-744(-)
MDSDNYVQLVEDPNYNSEANPKTSSSITFLQDCLVATLESQRQHYENRIESEEKKKIRRIKTLEENCVRMKDEVSHLERRLAEVERHKRDVEKQKEELMVLVARLKEEEESLKKDNLVYEEEQNQIEKKIHQIKLSFIEDDKNKLKKIHELEEQVRDLRFFIDAQKQLSNESALVDGQVIKVSSGGSGVTTPNNKARKRRGKGRGR